MASSRSTLLGFVRGHLRERPVLAFVFSIGGALLTFGWGITYVSLLRPPFNVPQVWAVVAGLASGLVVTASSVVLLVRPHHHVALGILIIEFSLLSLFSYFGVFCLGPAMGSFGGLVAIMSRDPVRAAGDPAPLALSVFGAFLIQVGVVFGTFGPYPFSPSPLWQILVGQAAAILVMAGGIWVYLVPTLRLPWGTVVVLSSIASFLGAYFGFAGGFFSLLAAARGMALAYRDRRQA